MYKRSLTINEKAYGSEHTSVASTLHNMAVVLQKQGRLDEAMAMSKRSLSINEKAYGSEHTSVAITLHNMAIVLQKQDRLHEAMAMYKRVQWIEQRHRQTTLSAT